MATKKLQDLTASTSPGDADILLIEDTAATKKITFLNLFNRIKTKLSLATVATSGKLADTVKDANNRTITDAERTKWNGYGTSIDSLNSNWEKLGGLRFDHQFIASVTAEYSADNVLSFAGSQLYPGNFTNCAFLAVLNSTASTGKQSVYLIIMGAADAAPVLIKIDGGSEALYPKLAKTSSNRVYAVWSTAATAGIHTSLFKLY
ncbi:MULTISPECIES: hypothetical protein [Clostridia]|uniref:hypothetical protein n=1 Tax=Clostridia TaxID=186801 RepID=UPI00067F0D5C|nr:MULTISPECIES: hypothetical protein [Clostridia]